MGEIQETQRDFSDLTVDSQFFTGVDLSLLRSVKPPCNMKRQTKAIAREKYWLTPPALLEQLDAQHHFDFDPCPCPRPEGYNSLIIPWGQSNYCNPPFHRDDGVGGKGPTAFVRKAIAEQALGKSTVLTLPAQLYITLLLDAGAELSSLGRVKWVHAETGEPCKSPSPIIKAVLYGKNSGPSPSL